MFMLVICSVPLIMHGQYQWETTSDEKKFNEQVAVLFPSKSEIDQNNEDKVTRRKKTEVSSLLATTDLQSLAYGYWWNYCVNAQSNTVRVNIQWLYRNFGSANTWASFLFSLASGSTIATYSFSSPSNVSSIQFLSGRLLSGLMSFSNWQYQYLNIAADVPLSSVYGSGSPLITASVYPSSLNVDSNTSNNIATMWIGVWCWCEYCFQPSYCSLTIGKPSIGYAWMLPSAVTPWSTYNTNFGVTLFRTNARWGFTGSFIINIPSWFNYVSYSAADPSNRSTVSIPAPTVLGNSVVRSNFTMNPGQLHIRVNASSNQYYGSTWYRTSSFSSVYNNYTGPNIINWYRTVNCNNPYSPWCFPIAWFY